MHYTRVVADDGMVFSCGDRQRAHLEALGVIMPMAQGVYKSAHTIHELNAIVLAEPTLRECDLCAEHPAGWKVECRRFTLRVGPNAGGSLGGPERPIFLCSECKPYVEHGDARRTLNFLCDRYISRAWEQRLLSPHVSKSQARVVIQPMLRDVVRGVLENKIGDPEEDV